MSAADHPGAGRYDLEKLQPEFDAYALWLEGLREQSAQRGGLPVSRHYRAKGLVLYTRLGATAVAGKPCVALCLASIDLDEARRGKGFLTQLVGDLQRRAPNLGVDVLTVESVLNEQLAHWLLRQGFHLYLSWDESVLGNYCWWLPPDPVADSL